VHGPLYLHLQHRKEWREVVLCHYVDDIIRAKNNAKSSLKALQCSRSSKQAEQERGCEAVVLQVEVVNESMQPELNRVFESRY